MGPRDVVENQIARVSGNVAEWRYCQSQFRSYRDVGSTTTELHVQADDCSVRPGATASGATGRESPRVRGTRFIGSAGAIREYADACISGQGGQLTELDMPVRAASLLSLVGSYPPPIQTGDTLTGSQWC